MTLFRFPDIEEMSSNITPESNTRVFTSPFTRAVKTQGRTGERLRARLTFRNLKAPDRERLQALLIALNGHENRVLISDHSQTRRGSIAGVSELLDVVFNATNWVPQQPTRISINDMDEGIRVIVSSIVGDSTIRPSTSEDGIANHVAGRIYCGIIYVGNFLGSPFNGDIPPLQLSIKETSTGTYINQSTVSVPTRLKVPALCYDTSEFFLRPILNVTLPFSAGGSFDLYDLGLSRCLMVDNGVNSLLRSEELDNGAWTKTRATASANTETAPDGATTADSVVEDSTASNNHYAQQSITKTAANEYWTFTCYLKETSTRDARLALSGTSDSDIATGTFDLGAGTVSASTVNGNFTNVYASIDALPNSWYRCRITARTDATADLRAWVLLVNAGSTIYNGDGSSDVAMWGAQVQQGFAHGRYIQTVGSAAAGTSQTGTSIWVKGGDASLNNLLRGDMVEIGNHIHMLSQDLRTDESGNGQIEVYPRVRTAPTDEDPVILHNPQGIFMLANPGVSWRNVPGVFSDFTLDFIQDIAA